MSQEQVLAIAAGLESHSEHPIAKAFVQYRDFSLNVTQIKVTASSGVSGIYQDKTYQIGRPSWLLENLDSSEADKLNNVITAQCVLVENNRLIAAFYLDDNIRDNALSL